MPTPSPYRESCGLKVTDNTRVHTKEERWIPDDSGQIHNNKTERGWD
jgi:hypothetical protein